MIVNFNEKGLQLNENDFMNYIVLDAKEFEYRDDQNKFEKSIEALNLINTIHWVNEFYKGVNSDLRIDTSIFYKVIEAGFTQNSFTDEELIAYYNAMVLVESFYLSVLKFKELGNYLPYELEFVLFGFSYDEQEYLSEKQKEQLHVSYGELYCDVIIKKIEVKVFIDKITVLINDLKKKVVEKRNKNIV